MILPRVESMDLIGGREYIVKKHRVAQEMTPAPWTGSLGSGDLFLSIGFHERGSSEG